MRTVEVNLYSFNELSEEAKEKAIDNLRDINLDYDWWDDISYDAERIGLKIESFDLDRNLHCEISPYVSALECAQNILNEYGETTETYKVAKQFLEDYEEPFARYMDESSEDYESSELEDNLLYLEKEFFKDMSNEYANILQIQYEYLYSDEAVIETIEANEYEFTEDGELA